MRYIGCLYARSSESLRLRKDAADDIAQAKALTAQCPFLCQANLLYSISLFWSDDRAGSRRYMDDAISMAISLGMHRQEFAAMFGEGDAILAESWRRTWWQIYIVEWNYTAITRETNSRMRDVCAAVDLPCEEHEYEAGAIPTPASLADFDSREFASESPSFSLFAYLIGSTRGIAQILAGTPLNKETYPPVEVVEAADAMVDGWILLLPDSKRPVMSKTGEIDELLFQAYMGMHAGMVGLHRPYSALLFDPLEEISSCFTNAPGNEPLDENTNIHTMRCLASVEAQIRLMTLPKRPFCHSPFTICMITTGTIPFLSACKFLLTGTKLSIAREQIRLTIGCLRSLAHVWPQGEKTVKEIQAIAREVLGLGASAASMSCPQHSTAASGTSSRVSGSQRSPESMNGSRDSSTMEESLFPDSMDSLSSYWDIQNQQIDMNLWFTNYS
ncbi:hypothetical protein QQS21_000751 [Conoideocrella luteorostrata]|uniref:Xylanolytic transcriptional activator regulatory domain-containing protein n=1 Tax=Conoideocrella luteorostrata TaxID=1105319 RepID=A0AAJ0D0P8_9HYPO|nr:hypothetical protein QQS21_000751 [Conoideocrella luteorostrata]